MWNQETPLGKVIAIAKLIDCVEIINARITKWKDIYGKDEISFDHVEPGRYFGILAKCAQIESVLAKADSGFRNGIKLIPDGR